MPRLMVDDGQQEFVCMRPDEYKKRTLTSGEKHRLKEWYYAIKDTTPLYLESEDKALFEKIDKLL